MMLTYDPAVSNVAYVSASNTDVVLLQEAKNDSTAVFREVRLCIPQHRFITD